MLENKSHTTESPCMWRSSAGCIAYTASAPATLSKMGSHSVEVREYCFQTSGSQKQGVSWKSEIKFTDFSRFSRKNIEVFPSGVFKYNFYSN